MKLKYILAFVVGMPIILITFIATFFFYKEVSEKFITERIHHLRSITETKKIRLQDMIEKKRELALMLKNNPELISEVNQSEEALNEPAERLLSEITDFLPSVSGFLVVDSANNRLFSTDERFSQRFLEKHSLSENHIDSLYIADFMYREDDRHYHVIVIPTREEFDRMIFLFQRTDDIFSLTTSYTGLGSTGETVLITDSGEIIAPTRFKGTNPSLSKNMIRNLRSNKEDLVVVEGSDYRGEEVLAAGAAISNLNWFIYTKMDMQEVKKQVRELRMQLILIDIVASIAAISIGIGLGFYLAKRLESINKSLKKIKSGDLSARTAPAGGSEISEVEEALNEMAVHVERRINLLQNSNKALNNYAYIVAHDIKAPVQAIVSLSDIILEKVKEKKEATDDDKPLYMLSEKAYQLERLVSGILNAAQQGFSNEEQEKISPDELIEEVIEDQKVPDNFQVNIKRPLPEVYFNPLLLYQVFQNLISNALKYNDKPVGDIQIEGYKQDDQVTFSVSDNGQGIPEDRQKRVFEMFGKAHTDTSKESHGIGLSTVRNIISGNGQKIWFESTPGKGTTFYFTMPAIKANR